MLTRRHIRIKVMQAVYALHKDPEQSLSGLQKNFQKQLLAAYDLYFVLYALLIALHLKAKERFEIKKQQEVLGGKFDSKNYTSERLFATAHDGIKIPISIVRHVNTELNQDTPILQYGYGSYGSTIDPSFASLRFVHLQVRTRKPSAVLKLKKSVGFVLYGPESVIRFGGVPRT